jgi:C4-dicarboxylate transporter DctQ subunit
MMNQKIRRTGTFLLKVHDRLCDGCARAAAWIMLGMALIITYEVLARYFFNRPTIWVSDFTDYIMLYSTFFVSAWLLKHDGHVRLTIVLEHLSQRTRVVMEMVNSFIGAIVCGFVIWYGVADVWDAVINSIVLARPLPVPKYLVLGVIPFGCLLLSVQFLRDAFKSLNDLKALSKQKVGGATLVNEQRR